MAADFDSLLAQYNASYQQARAANESRYNDIVSGYEGRYQRGLQNLQGLGAYEAEDIARRYTQLGAQQNQNLIGRGLNNTTIAGTMARGLQQDYTREQGALQGRLRQQYMAADAGLSGDKLAFMERRTDQYPDPALLAQLGLAMGAKQAAMRAGVIAPGGQTGAMTGGPQLTRGLGAGSGQMAGVTQQGFGSSGFRPAGQGTGPGMMQQFGPRGIDPETGTMMQYGLGQAAGEAVGSSLMGYLGGGLTGQVAGGAGLISGLGQPLGNVGGYNPYMSSGYDAEGNYGGNYTDYFNALGGGGGGGESGGSAPAATPAPQHSSGGEQSLWDRGTHTPDAQNWFWRPDSQTYYYRPPTA